MHHVYIINSIKNSEAYYTGYTKNPIQRLKYHNAGLTKSTEKNRPWRFVSIVSFLDKGKAMKFEKYLKSGSGRAIAKKHLR